MPSFRSFAPAAAALLLSALVPPGCGSGGSDSSGQDPAAFAAAYCALYEPCCAAAGLPTGSQASCHALFGTLPAQDPSAVQPCLDAYTAQAKSADFCKLTMDTPDACKRAFPQQSPQKQAAGTKTPGQACSGETDCAASTQGEVHCSTPFSGGTGSICQLATHAKAGEACVGTVDGNVRNIDGNDSGSTLAFCYRADGVYCDKLACKTIAAVGASCTADAGCTSDAYCANSSCVTKLAAGASCEKDSSACDAASYCDFATNVCKARVAEGAACDGSEQCTTSWCSDGKCGKPSSSGFALLLFCQ